MPATSRGSDRVLYPPLPPPKKQIRFPGRRTSARPRGSILPKLTKAQSTLTQIDFIASTPSASRDPIEVSSDDEFRPRKRRKTKFDTKEPGQATLTQKYDLRGLTGIRNDSADDHAGFQVWDDEAAAEAVTRVRKSFIVEDSLEIPETSQVATASFPRADSGVDMGANRGSSRLQTPKKYDQREIPSSQTPASTKSHRSAARLRLGLQRSPLKERSANVQAKATSRSPESGPIDSKIANLRQDFDAALQERLEKETKQEHKFNVNGSLCPLPRKLARTTTIQDSQFDDFNSIPPMRRTVLNLQTSPRKLQRTTTIQDSEYDSAEALSNSTSRDQQMKDQASLDVMDESQPHIVVEDSELEEADTHQYDFDDYVEPSRQIGVETQATYDPAFSALDRDAARFGWTQTQRALLSGIAEGHEDSETDDDDDLDRGCIRSQSINDAHGGQPLLDAAGGDEADDVVAPEAATVERMHPEIDSVEVEKAANANLNNDVEDANLEQDAVIPSSPPVFPAELPPILSSPEKAELLIPPSPVQPRSSQVSIVVPTQASVLHLCTDLGEDEGTSMRYADCSEASTIPPFSSSPHKLVKYHYLESQLPPPPSHSPTRPQSKHVRDTKHRAPAVEDWSLCPPPPVSSSRARTPASSSR